MKVAVLNFSGNVGKSTIARHLILPRLSSAELIPVESINSDDSDEAAIRGKQFGQLAEYLMTVDNAVIDIGASNVEDFVKLMKQYHGSHEDFDYFVVPVVKENKQQRDTISTIDALSSLGVPAKKIRIIFNRLDVDDPVEQIFNGIFAYQKAEKKFTLKADAIIYNNEVFEKIKYSGKTIQEVISDQTDYKVLIKSATTQEEKIAHASAISLKRLAVGVQDELDEVFKALFK